MLNINEFLKDLILPPLCPVCGKLSTRFLCKNCAEKIRFLGFNICLRCGRPLAVYDWEEKFDKSISGSKICNLCRNEPYNFYKLRSFTEYDDVTSKIILKYKYKKFYYLADLLVDFLELAYKSYYLDEKIDFIDTVPDYCGESHMHLIAKKLSRVIAIPFINNVIKIRNTPKQHSLDKTQREFNLQGAFKIVDCLKNQNKNFLIIDDVWTTGSTLNEISSVLKKSGANRIYLLTIARKV